MCIYIYIYIYIYVYLCMCVNLHCMPGARQYLSVCTAAALVVTSTACRVRVTSCYKILLTQQKARYKARAMSAAACKQHSEQYPGKSIRRAATPYIMDRMPALHQTTKLPTPKLRQCYANPLSPTACTYSSNLPEQRSLEDRALE